MLLQTFNKRRQSAEQDEEHLIRDFMLSHNVTIDEARKLFENKQKSIKDFKF